MAFVSHLFNGAIVVREFQSDYLAVVACAQSWEDVIDGVAARIAALVRPFKHTHNWVFVARVPSNTRYQRWVDALKARDRGYSLWKDSVCEELLREDKLFGSPYAGAARVSEVQEMLRNEDVAAILAMQSEPDTHKVVDMAHLNDTCPLPPFARRGEWIANPFIIAGLLMPFLGRLATTGDLAPMVIEHLGGKRRKLCLVFDALHLPTDRSYRELHLDTRVVVLRTSSDASVKDVVAQFGYDVLTQHTVALRTSPDPLARTAAWMLLATLCLGRTTLYLGANRVPSIVAMIALEHQVFLHINGAKVRTFGDIRVEPLPHLAALLSGRIRLTQIDTDSGEAGSVDLTTLMLNLRSLYDLPAASVAHAAVASGVLLEDGGVPEMVHRDTAGDDLLAGSTRMCVPHNSGPSSFGVPFLRAFLNAITPSAPEVFDEASTNTQNRVKVGEYVSACHNAFLLNHYVGEVYAPFQRLETLACDNPRADTYGFSTWLNAVRRAGTFVYHDSKARWDAVNKVAEKEVSDAHATNSAKASQSPAAAQV